MIIIKANINIMQSCFSGTSQNQEKINMILMNRSIKFVSMKLPYLSNFLSFCFKMINSFIWVFRYNNIIWLHIMKNDLRIKKEFDDFSKTVNSYSCSLRAQESKWPFTIMISDIGKVISTVQKIQYMKVAFSRSTSSCPQSILINLQRWNSKLKSGTQISRLRQELFVWIFWKMSGHQLWLFELLCFRFKRWCVQLSPMTLKTQLWQQSTRIIVHCLMSMPGSGWGSMPILKSIRAKFKGLWRWVSPRNSLRRLSLKMGMMRRKPLRLCWGDFVLRMYLLLWGVVGFYEGSGLGFLSLGYEGIYIFVQKILHCLEDFY